MPGALEELRAVIARWRQAAGTSSLTELPGDPSVIRRLHGGHASTVRLRGAALELYAALDRPTSREKLVHGWHDPEREALLVPDVAQLAARVMRRQHSGVDTNDPVEAYRHLLAYGVVVEEGGYAVRVACRPEPVPEGGHPPAFVQELLEEVVS